MLSPKLGVWAMATAVLLIFSMVQKLVRGITMSTGKWAQDGVYLRSLTFQIQSLSSKSFWSWGFVVRNFLAVPV
ncbi:hypothetical protein ALP29_200879 [Pseudomonas syringae pv. avii]|uniref:Uncharacterized protein n=1 Tax=Pseudomonas syringae pv. avii TaxID=663959 RepID=A0A3M5VMS7_PSESX|nr:hypothetical protein ALP43_200330 [Pseudomonas azotoformans]RMU59044.1 hypothetical protein ALP29_200879 [Pseudomonas syringae pv. avii]